MSDIKTALQEFVATYNDPKVNKDIDKTLSYFPELKGFDKNTLAEYIATYEDPKVKGDWEKVNSYFPEFFAENNKTQKTTTPKTTAPEQNAGGFAIPMMFGNEKTIAPDPNTGIFTPEIAAGLRGEIQKPKSPMPDFFKKDTDIQGKIYGEYDQYYAPVTPEQEQQAKQSLERRLEQEYKIQHELRENTSYQGRFLDDLGEKMYSTTAGLIGGTLDLADRLETKNILTEIALRNAAGSEGYKASEELRKENATTLKKVADWLTTGAEEMQSKSNTTFRGKSGRDLWKEGQYGSSVMEYVLSGAGSFPTSVMAFTPVGLGVIGGGSFNQKYDEVSRNTDRNMLISAINAGGTASFELLTEKIGAGIEKGLLKKLAKDVGRDVAERSVKVILKEWTKTIAKDSGTEFLEEAINKGASDILDIATGVQKVSSYPEAIINTLSGMVDAGLYGAAGGAFGGITLGGPIVGASFVKLQSDKKQAESTFNDADRRLTAMLSRNGFTAEEVQDVKNSMLQANPENRNDVVLAIAQAIPEAITRKDGKVVFNPEIGNVFTDFYIGSDKLQSVNKAYNETMEAERAKTIRLEKENAAKELQRLAGPDGMIRTVKLKDGTTVQVRGESMVFDENGMFDMKNSSTMLYYTDEAGQPKMMKPYLIESLVEEKPIEQAAMEADQLIDQEISDKEIDEFLPLQPEVYRDEQGTIQVQYNPETMEIEAVLVDENSMTPISDPYAIDKTTYSQMSGKPMPEAIKTTANEPINEGGAPVVSGDMTENAPEAAPKYPVNKKGEIDFDAMTVAQTYQYMVDNYGQQEAVEALQLQEKNTQAAISANIKATDKFKSGQYAEVKKATTIQEQLKIREKHKATAQKLTDERAVLDAQLAEIRALMPQVEQAPAQPEVKPVTSSNVRPEVQFRREQEAKAKEEAKESTQVKDAKEIVNYGTTMGEAYDNIVNNIIPNLQNIAKEKSREIAIAKNIQWIDLTEQDYLSIPEYTEAKRLIQLSDKMFQAETMNETTLDNLNYWIEQSQRKKRTAPVAEAEPANLDSANETLTPNLDSSVIEVRAKEKNKSIINPWQRRLNNLGDAMTVEDVVLRRIAGGAKFVWTANSPLKGMADELGFANKPGERELRKSMIDNENGMTPQEFAHVIYESGDLDFMPGVEYQDVYNAVLDTLLSVNSATDAIETAERLRDSREFSMNEQAEWDSMTEAEMQYLEEIPDDILESYLGITNFTPQQLDIIQNLQNEYYGTDTTTTETSAVDSTQGIESETAAAGTTEGISTEQIQSETDLNPTEAQKKAGNYKKAHIAVSGMDISIENPVGSVRRGTDEDGKAWEHEMKSHYGYFLKTEGKDGDHIDTFIKEGIPTDWNGTVFPIDQINPKTGAFDETKVMIGYETPEEAKAAYMENYDADWKGFSAITPVSLEDFKTWLYDGKKQRKPYAEYKDTPEAVESTESKMNESWRNEFERAKAANDLKALDTLYNKVKVVLNGLAQGKGEATVKDFEALKSEMEAYAAELESGSSEKPNNQSVEANEMVEKPTEATSAPKYKNGDTVYYKGKPYVINGLYNGELMYDLETEDGKEAFEEVPESELNQSDNSKPTEESKPTTDKVSAAQSEETNPKQTVKDVKQTSPELDLVTASTELATAKAKYDKAYNKYIDLKNKLEKDPAFGMGGQTDIFGNVSGADNLFGNDGQKQAVEAVQAAKKQADDLKQAVDELQAKADKLREAVTNKILKQQEVKFEEEKVPEQAKEEPLSIEEKTKVEKIEDFGEVIDGAKKHLATRNTSTEKDIESMPLSKTFPKPDFALLVESGQLTEDAAIILSFLYDNIPAKPRANGRMGAYKLSNWVKKVQQAIDMYNDFLLNDTKSKKLIEGFDKLEKTQSLGREYVSYKQTIQALGFPRQNVSVGNYRIKQFEGREGYSIVNGSLILGDYTSLEKAGEALSTMVNANKATATKEGVKLSVYQDTKTKKYFIGRKTATGILRIMNNIETLAEARTIFKEQQSMLQQLWADMKTVDVNERRSENRSRIGTDYRKGKDVTPEDFNTFGFRGVQFGNYVNAAERQKALNDAYDGLMDLANVIGVTPKALSLNGQLGIAFGARGSGGKKAPSAHYEPGEIVINITKNKGAGSLAHEWWHALDNYFSRMRGYRGEFLTDNPRVKRISYDKFDESVRPEAIAAFKTVVDAIKASGIEGRSEMLDQTRSKRYWTEITEMSARSFENYIIEKLGATGQQNDYLANFKAMSEWVNEGGLDNNSYPYPTVEESPNINKAFDNLFEVIQEDDNGALYQIGSEGIELVSESEHTALVEQLKKTGLADDVVMLDSKGMSELEGGKRQVLNNNIVQDATETQIKVNGNWYARKIFKESENAKVGDFVPELEKPTDNSVNNKLVRESKDYFGTTDNFNVAGYLTTDGSLLDFSGKHYGGSNKNDYRTRGVDHRDINEIEGTDIVDFMSYGNIRLKPESNGFELTKIPTKEQFAALKKFLQWNKQNGNVYIDFSEPGSYGINHSVYYQSGYNIDRVLNDIRNYYENGVKPTGSTRFLRTHSGTIYGAVKNGVVYLNKDRLNLNTPIHEFGHLYMPIVKQQFPEFFAKGVELIKQTAYYEEVKNDPNYSNLDEDGVIDEALNRAVGDNGAKIVKEKGVGAKLLEWIKALWERLGKIFGIKDLTSEQISNLTMKDWVDLVNAEMLKGKKLKSNVKVSDNGFYSTVENALDKLSQEKGTKDQFKAMLLKNGAKQAEMDWMGFDELPEKLTKADIQNWIDANRIEVKEVEKSAIYAKQLNDVRKEIQQNANRRDYLIKVSPELTEDVKSELIIISKNIEQLEDDARNLEEKANIERDNKPKYSQYVLPGGENYKELLLTMPVENRITFEEFKQDYFKRFPNSTHGEETLRRWYKEGVMVPKNGSLTSDSMGFKSSHFDEPNILAHIRFNERTVNGERVLFIEEIQSDFSQSLKKKEDEFKKLLKENPDKVLDMFKKSGKLEVLCP